MSEAAVIILLNKIKHILTSTDCLLSIYLISIFVAFFIMLLLSR